MDPLSSFWPVSTNLYYSKKKYEILKIRDIQFTVKCIFLKMLYQTLVGSNCPIKDLWKSAIAREFSYKTNRLLIHFFMCNIFLLDFSFRWFLGDYISESHLNPFSINVSLLYALYTAKNRGYRSGTLVENEFMLTVNIFLQKYITGNGKTQERRTGKTITVFLLLIPSFS